MTPAPALDLTTSLRGDLMGEGWWWLGKVLARLHARLPVGWAGIGAWKLPYCLETVVPTIPQHTITWKRLLSPCAN